MDLLLEMHAMLKEQGQAIKKLKKRHELSKRTTLNLQHHIDSICDSLDELSRRTLDSDLSSADLSSALSLMSSKARSDDSSDSLDSAESPVSASKSPKPSTILFSANDFCTFDRTDAPVDIHPRRTLTDDNTNSQSSSTWSSPKQKKKHFSNLKLPATSLSTIATDNPFSPLADEPPVNGDPLTTLSSLGRTRSPSKKPAPKKLRCSPASPDALSRFLHDEAMFDSDPNFPKISPDPPDQTMFCDDDDSPTQPTHDVLPMNESVDDSL
jgi:hypothetical protein